MYDYLKLLFRLIQEAGKAALAQQEHSAYSLKPDNSVLTQADLAVSKLVHDGLKDLLAGKEHILIDEEDSSHPEYLDQKYLEKIPYIWVMDPIDGTRGFSNRLPSFGISIGVLKELKPWLSAVYLPLMDELFYADGKSAYYVRHPFGSKPQSTTIMPFDQEITNQSIFWANDTMMKRFDWDYKLCQAMHYSCAVFDLCYPAIGRGCGSFFNSYIWDFAGSWPIFEAAGLKLRALDSARTIDRLEVGLFQNKGTNTWRAAEYYLLSSEKNFPIIKSALQPRTH